MGSRAGTIAHQLKAFAAPTEDLVQVPAPIWMPSQIIFNSSSRESDTLFWLLVYMACTWYIHTHLGKTCTHIGGGRRREKEVLLRTGEMAQWLRAFAVLAKDQGSV